MVNMSTTIAKLSNRPTDFRDTSWGILPNEPSDTYDVFLQFLFIGPKRTLREGYRRWLIKEKKLLPGQPPPDPPARLHSAMSDWSWHHRAHDWDEKNWENEVAVIEEAQAKLIHDMVNRQIEGWQVLQSAAIQSFFKRDEEGDIMYDEEGVPIIEMIEDKAAALRTWRQAVTGERVARGLPSELLSMTNEQIQRRIVEIHAEIEKLESDDDDIIEGEYSEE